MAYNDMVYEDRLFNLYEIVLNYIPENEREELAQHIYDWLRSWEAPAGVYDGLADNDADLAELVKQRGLKDEYEDEEEDEEDEYYDEDEYYEE